MSSSTLYLVYIVRVQHSTSTVHSKYNIRVLKEYLRERAEAAVAVDRGKAKQLVEMGFPEMRARAALAAKYAHPLIANATLYLYFPSRKYTYSIKIEYCDCEVLYV